MRGDCSGPLSGCKQLVCGFSNLGVRAPARNQPCVSLSSAHVAPYVYARRRRARLLHFSCLTYRVFELGVGCCPGVSVFAGVGGGGGWPRGGFGVGSAAVDRGCWSTRVTNTNGRPLGAAREPCNFAECRSRDMDVPCLRHAQLRCAGHRACFAARQLEHRRYCPAMVLGMLRGAVGRAGSVRGQVQRYEDTWPSSEVLIRSQCCSTTFPSSSVVRVVLLPSSTQMPVATSCPFVEPTTAQYWLASAVLCPANVSISCRAAAALCFLAS